MKMKKNVAVVMSAVMAAGVVAPVLANAADKTETVDAVTAKQKVKDALATKYTANVDGQGNPAGNEVERSVYKIEAKKVGGADVLGALVTDSEVLDKIQELIDSGDAFEVKITDKGHRTDSDGKIVDKVSTDYKVIVDTVSDANVEVNWAGLLTPGAVDILKNVVKENGVKITDTTDAVTITDANAVGFVGQFVNVKKVEMTLKNDAVLTFENNVDAVDFEKPVNADGTVVAASSLEDEGMQKTVTGFEKVKSVDASNNPAPHDVDMPNGDTNTYKVSKLTKYLEYNISEIYTKDGGFTEKGADLLNAITLLADANGNKTNIEGVNYEQLNITDKSISVEKDGDNYVLKVNFGSLVNTVESVGGVPAKVDLTIKITGSSYDDIKKVEAGIGTDVTEGRYERIVGSNRYETAIEVSKERFEDKKAKSVVIVGAEALTDGLAAGPLAAEKEAPILLSGKSGLNSATLDEIDRVVDKPNDKIAYIVGGEASVPASVEKQLKDKFGLTVVRVSGANRYETSIAILKRLSDYDKNITIKELFFVGGNGAPDAMSASAVASVKGNLKPIIVVKKDNVDREARRVIANYNLSNAYVVGGRTHISDAGFRDIKNAVNGIATTRLAGANRYETNAVLVKKFAKPFPNEKSLYLASAKDAALVDALTAGPLAAKNESQIMLVGSSLNKAQKELFAAKDVSSSSKAVYKEDVVKDLTQIGGAVDASTVKEVVDLLGL